ncbi:MAG: hypothetical protein EOP62_21540 [Sphingomonadales bacterium]|nr:MAG: hypothetical protein EOP62_21540 [Sphingomonadales bacterium]
MKGKVLMAVLALVCTSCATAGSGFDGQWVYRQECGFGHIANLELQQKGNVINGAWGDGTRVRGESGLLKGFVDGRRARFWLCSESSDDAGHTCPNFGREEAYLERVGDTLVWYRGTSVYITLHPGGAGRTVPIDDSDCVLEDE